MNILNGVKEILEGVMDIDKEEISKSSFLVRDLEVESIDFLEIAVELNHKFKIDVEDNRIFLRSLRLHIETGGVEAVKEAYPYLGENRIQEIMSEYHNGPVLKVSDLVDYVEHHVA